MHDDTEANSTIHDEGYTSSSGTDDSEGDIYRRHVMDRATKAGVHLTVSDNITLSIK